MTYEEHLKAENEHLQEELRAALTSKHVAINKNEVLREDIHKLKRENQSLRGDCDILRRDRAAAEAAVRRLESDNAFGIEQRNVAEAEVRRLWNENDALRKMVVTSPRLHEDLDALKRANEQLGAELRDRRQKLPTERLTTKQPPPGGHGDVWADIIAKLPAYHPMRAKCIARRELGLARYGQPLRYGTGRPEDLEEELLDAAGYAWRDRRPWALVLHLLAVAAEPGTVKLALDSPTLRTRVRDLEVGLDDLLAARELMDVIHRTLTRAGGDR